MTIDGEPAKVLLPFLQRADELQKHDHRVAYYCRLYAMEKGLKIPVKERTNDTKALLISLMNQLEKDKKVVQASADDNMYMEGFALGVFSKADKQDRAGRADLNTAKTFYAASTFFEVLLQFGELPPDIQEKQKYASWKAADIRKAVAEHRKPVPGPPGGVQDAPDGDDMSWNVEEGNTNGAPETPPPAAPSTLIRDTSLRSTSMDTSSHTNISSSPPSELSFQHSYSRSSEDINLPSAPSDPIPPSYSQNPHASTDSTGYPSSAPPSHQPGVYPHSSGTPFDSLRGFDKNPASSTVGSYSYPKDPAGYTASTPSNYSSYPSTMPRDEQHGPSQQDPSPYHQPQQHWPGSPYNEPTSTYPSVCPEASTGYHPTSTQHPSIPPHGASRYPEPPATLARTSSAPGAPELSGGYQMNGTYDHNYEPTPAQVVEAHKASRFAVSALAFDDVPTAVAHLRKSLELLTSPSATT